MRLPSRKRATKSERAKCEQCAGQYDAREREPNPEYELEGEHDSDERNAEHVRQSSAPHELVPGTPPAQGRQRCGSDDEQHEIERSKTG
jgi:hypothetical protein